MIYVEHACIIVFKCHMCTHNAIVLWPKGPDGRGVGVYLSSCPWQWPNLSSYSHHSKAVFSLTSLVPVSFIYYNLDTTKHVCCPTLQVMLKRGLVLSIMALTTTTVLQTFPWHYNVAAMPTYQSCHLHQQKPVRPNSKYTQL